MLFIHVVLCIRNVRVIRTRWNLYALKRELRSSFFYMYGSASLGNWCMKFEDSIVVPSSVVDCPVTLEI
jgi:hypothetical protein